MVQHNQENITEIDKALERTFYANHDDIVKLLIQCGVIRQFYR